MPYPLVSKQIGLSIGAANRPRCVTARAPVVRACSPAVNIAQQVLNSSKPSSGGSCRTPLNAMSTSGLRGLASDGSMECLQGSVEVLNQGSGDHLESRVQWLRNFPPFSSLTDAALQDLAARMRARAVRPGDVLHEAGVNVDGLVVLHSGTADVSNDKAGTQGEPCVTHEHYLEDAIQAKTLQLPVFSVF